MEVSQMYISISIITLLILAILFGLKVIRREETTFTPRASLAFGFILLGIMFGDERLIGYGLMGVGVVIAIADIIARNMNKDKETGS